MQRRLNHKPLISLNYFSARLSGDAGSLSVEGEENITVYQATRDTGEQSTLERRFCSKCGSSLWCWDPRWPDLIHPFASAIDTSLPVPPEYVHLMLGSKAGWVPVHEEPDDKCFDEYPQESIAAWHQRLGLEAE